MDPADTAPFVISIIGTISSAVLQLSPLGVVREIRRNQKVGCYRPDPFITGVGFGLINGAYSIISGQLISAISCGIGLSLFTSYLLTYVYYSHHKARDIRKTTIFLLVSLGITGIGPLIFTLVDTSDSGHNWLEANGGLTNMIHIWVGICATISIVLMFSGQLTNMAEVIRLKDARSISLMMACGGLFCSVSWAIYAGLILNPYYIVSNGLGVISASTQIVLKRMYPDVPEEIKSTEA